MSRPRFRFTWPLLRGALLDRGRFARWANALRSGPFGSRPARWLLFAAVSLFLIAAIGSLSAFLLARSNIRKLEQRFHATIELGPVIPCGLGVCLRDVKVRFEDAPGLSVNVAKTRLRPAFRGQSRSVAVDGLHASWKGTAAEVEAQARALSARVWRTKEAGGASPSEAAPTTVRVANASFSWQTPDGAEGVRAQGVEVEKTGGDIRLFAEELRGAVGKRSIALSRGRAYLRRDAGEMHFVSADAQELRLEQSEGAAATDSTLR